jgi:hypothetical protein
MYVKGSPVEIQTPKHCNVIGQGVAAPLPLLSPNSILPSFSSYYLSSTQGKNLPASEQHYFF